MLVVDKWPNINSVFNFYFNYWSNSLIHIWTDTFYRYRSTYIYYLHKYILMPMSFRRTSCFISVCCFGRSRRSEEGQAVWNCWATGGGGFFRRFDLMCWPLRWGSWVASLPVFLVSDCTCLPFLCSVCQCPRMIRKSSKILGFRQNSKWPELSYRGLKWNLRFCHCADFATHGLWWTNIELSCRPWKACCSSNLLVARICWPAIALFHYQGKHVWISALDLRMSLAISGVCCHLAGRPTSWRTPDLSSSSKVKWWWSCTWSSGPHPSEPSGSSSSFPSFLDSAGWCRTGASRSHGALSLLLPRDLAGRDSMPEPWSARSGIARPWMRDAASRLGWIDQCQNLA